MKSLEIFVYFFSVSNLQNLWERGKKIYWKTVGGHPVCAVCLARSGSQWNHCNWKPLCNSYSKMSWESSEEWSSVGFSACWRDHKTMGKYSWVFVSTVFEGEEKENGITDRHTKPYPQPQHEAAMNYREISCSWVCFLLCKLNKMKTELQTSTLSVCHSLHV